MAREQAQAGFQAVVVVILPLGILLTTLLGVLVNGVLNWSPEATGVNPGVKCVGTGRNGDTGGSGRNDGTTERAGCRGKPPAVTIFVIRNADGQRSGGDTLVEVDADTLRNVRDKLRNIADQSLVLVGIGGRDGASDDILREVLERMKNLSQRLSPPLRVTAAQPAGVDNDADRDADSRRSTPEDGKDASEGSSGEDGEG